MYDSTLLSRLPPRILVLEPNPGAAEIVGEILETVGCVIAGPYGTLRESIIALQAGGGIDGAVLEIRVAGSYSFELAALLINSNRAVIFFSRCDPRILPQHLQAATFLRKPKGIELLAGAAAAAFF